MDWIYDYKIRWGGMTPYHCGEGAGMIMMDAIGPCEDDNPSTHGGGANFIDATDSENSGSGEVKYIYDYKYGKPF